MHRVCHSGIFNCMQARNEDFKIVRQNEKLVCFPRKWVGFGEGLCPILNLDFLRVQ